MEEWYNQKFDEEPVVIRYGEMVWEGDLFWSFVGGDMEDTMQFPKSQCAINEKELKIAMPQWLYDKKFNEYD